MGVVSAASAVTQAGAGCPPAWVPQNHHSSLHHLPLFPASFSCPSFGDAALCQQCQVTT